MAITNITRDVRYPSVGDKVTIKCLFTAGTGKRFRCRLIDKPIDSALVVYTAANDTWLTNNQITPDVVGRFRVELVEELVVNPVPTFSNDLGAGQCIETISTVDTDSHYMTVMGKVKRQIGFAPDDVTLEAYTATDDFAPSFLSPTSGVLTRYTDATRCPKLTNPGSDIAKIAAAYDTIARQVAEIGGYGNESAASGVASYKYGDRADQILPIIPETSLADSAILTSFAWMINRMNDHIEEQAVMIHGAPDANEVTAADAVAGDEPSQRLLLNDILTILSAHVAIGGGGVHNTADTIATAALAGLAALPNPSTLAQRIARANALFDIMDDHFTQVFLALDPASGIVHDTTGDNHMSYSTLYPVWNDATVVACANAMKVQYNLHRVRVVLLAALYHAIPGDVHCTYNDAMPVDSAGFIAGVRKALQVWQAHVTNIEFDSGATIVYHTAADFGSRTDVIPGPSDYAGAINAMEALNWTISKHASLGVPTHGYQQAGRIKIRPYGVEAIHHAFRTGVTYTGMTVGNVENAAYARLIMGGGFSKG